jgi:hypothetical protein
MLFVNILFFLFCSAAFALPTPWYKDVSFVITCENKNNPAHLVPLSFFEFSDDVDLRVLPQSLSANFTKIAPITFKSLDKGLKSLTVTPKAIFQAELYRVDPLINPPQGCQVEIMAIRAYAGKTSEYEVNQKLWAQVPPKLQGYYLLEAYLQHYLSDDLSAVDYRRFSLYVYAGVFESYSIEQKIFFLKHHGITELTQSNVSLDLNRRYTLYEEGVIQEAFGYPKATFETGEIDKLRMVRFFKTGAVSHVATLTPFKRKIKDQEFEFFATKLDAPVNERYDYRTTFYPSGAVKSSEVIPFKNLFSLVTEIKKSGPFSKRASFHISFHENQNPSYLNFSTGVMNILGKPMNIGTVSWWENGNPHEVFFTEREFVTFQNKTQEVGGLSFDENGIPRGRF